MGTLTVAGQRLTASVLNHMYGTADATTRSVTAATETQLSSQYVIAANDATTSNAYRLTCWGTGTQGSSAQSLTFRANTLGGGGLASAGIGSGFATTSGGFRWWARMTCVASAIGSGGTITGFLEGGVVQTGTTNASTAFNATFQGNSVNTAANWGIEIDCAWGSTTGAPTISCAGTLFERVG